MSGDVYWLYSGNWRRPNGGRTSRTLRVGDGDGSQRVDNAGVEAVDRPAGGGQRRQRAGEHAPMVAAADVRHSERRLENPHGVGRLTEVEQMLTDHRQHGERAAFQPSAGQQRFRRQQPLWVARNKQYALLGPFYGE